MSPATEKENAGLHRTTILAALDKGAQKRKRITILVNGEDIDLSSANGIPLTPQVFEAMRLRILQLEDELCVQSSQPPAKRAKTTAASTAPVASTSAAAPAGSSKADEKKRKIQLKKIFDRLKKECKAEGFKFQGMPKQLKIDEVWEQSEFEALFSGKGTLIQPTPDNKPKSTVTIIQFNKAQAISFFGDELKALKGNVWSRGGGPFFSKSIKQGSCDVEINSFEVNYSKNGMKCALKFLVEQAGGGGYGGSSYDW